MLQIKNLTLTHKKDLREILSDFSCVFNNGDKAVIIGEEGNGKSTLLKWLYDPLMVEEYCEAVLNFLFAAYTLYLCLSCTPKQSLIFRESSSKICAAESQAHLLPL